MYCQHCKAYVHDSMLSHHKCPSPAARTSDDSDDLLSTGLAVAAVESLLDSGSSGFDSTPDTSTPDSFSGGGADGSF